jgi:hypothetical protein
MSRKPISRKVKSARRARPPARPLRSRKPDAVNALAAAGVKALAVPVEPAWHATIVFNLQLLLKHAALIDAFALPDESEPAPVFRA